MKKYLIVGLGNPGFRYRKNRHNAGYIVIDEIIDSLKLNGSKKINDAKVFNYKDRHGEFILIKPLLYMNNSGTVVNAFLYKEKIPTENLVVIYDDIDIAFGSVRYRKKGSAGTHNGMRSIIEKIGTSDFKRIRIGVDRPEKGQDLVRYVLGNFSKQQLKVLKEEIAVQTIEKLLDGFLSDNGDIG